MRLDFYRENKSALSSLVDSHRIAPTHATRRSQQLIPSVGPIVSVFVRYCFRLNIFEGVSVPVVNLGGAGKGMSWLMWRLGGAGGGAYSFVACLSHLTIDHASLSRRSTVPLAGGAGGGGCGGALCVGEGPHFSLQHYCYSLLYRPPSRSTVSM